tara:strand:+ start:122 stop:598 length:477 start_codon:yes stop_codon:yes gene_type:complete
MAREVSAQARLDVYAQETEEAFVLMLEIDEATLAEPIRLARNNSDIDHNSQTYLACAFEANLPGDGDSDLEEVRITIGNVDQRVTDAVMEAQDVPVLTLFAVPLSRPNELLIPRSEFDLERVQVTPGTVSAVLSFDNVTNQRYPRDTKTPYTFPAGVY